MRNEVMHPNGDVTFQIPREKYERMRDVRNYILINMYTNGYSRSWMITLAQKKFGCSENFCKIALNKYKNFHFGQGIRIRPIEQKIEEDRLKRERKCPTR